MKCSKRDFSFWYSDPQFSVALLLCCKSVLCISLLAPKAFLLHRNITFFFFRDFIYLFDGESVCMRGCGRGGAEGEGEADSLLSREPDMLGCKAGTQGSLPGLLTNSATLVPLKQNCDVFNFYFPISSLPSLISLDQQYSKL